MCGTCGCRDAESYEAPFFEMDDVCVSCGADEVAYESNICEGCQIRFGIEKLGAESFEVEENTDNVSVDELIKHLRENRGSYEQDGEVRVSVDDGNPDGVLYLGNPNEDMEVILVDNLDDSQRRAETFEAQRKITDVDRDGKPYTGQIYPDHPNLDPVKADRNNDGYMSSWERALGNQVAMGMERGGYSAESFHSEGTGSRFPWKTLIALAVGAFALTRVKNVEFKAHDCGCGCKGNGGCGDKKEAETFNAYPEVYDPVADFLPRYRYPADSVWSNDYNPADPYRPLDYQTVHTDSNTKAKRM